MSKFYNWVKERVDELPIAVIIVSGFVVFSAFAFSEFGGTLATLRNSMLAAVITVSPPHRDEAMQLEHDKLLALVPISAVTTTAVKNGLWSDPTVWSTGSIPTDNDRVHIPVGIRVQYDQVSDARIKTIRIDGKLSFKTDSDTKLVVDTLVGVGGSEFELGTEYNPVKSGVTARIVIAGKSPIDIAVDPMRIGRGVVLHGKATMRGETKTNFVAVTNQPVAGATTLTLASVPTNWRVGDKVVITGTDWRNLLWNGSAVVYPGTYDEERTIKSISGTTVTVDPLQYSHATGKSNLTPYLANYTRNVIIESEEGASAPIPERGHVMFMHSTTVDVRYVAFNELGRTDKASLNNDAQFDADGNLVPGTGTNQRGRYPVHVHRVGLVSGYNGTAAYIKGVAVWGSPGWGVVNHESYALVEDSASYNVLGSHYVTEAGNEIGAFRNNIAIKASGDKPNTSLAAAKDGTRVNLFDVGQAGHGFWLQGRIVELSGNVVSGVNNAAYEFMHRGDSGIAKPLFPPRLLQYPEIIKLYQDVVNTGGNGFNYFDASSPPIRKAENNVAMASLGAFQVIKANPDQAHDSRTIVDGVTGINNCYGMEVTYTAHYTFKNIYLRADTKDPGTGVILQCDKTYAMAFAPNGDDFVIENVTIDGYQRGIEMVSRFNNVDNFMRIVVINPQFLNGVVLPYYAQATTTTATPWTPQAQYGQYAYTISEAQAVAKPLTLDVDPNQSYKAVWRNKDTYSFEPFVVNGTKSDGYGTIPFRDVYTHNVRVVKPYLTTDGKKVIKVKSLYFDRKTNECKAFPFYLDVTDVTSIWQNLGAPPALSAADYQCAKNDVTVKYTTPPQVSCTEQWTCGEWSACTAGTQTRTCSDSNLCGTTVSKSPTTQTCTAADTIPPTVPTGLQGTAVSTTQINLSWTVSTDDTAVAGYKVYRNGTQVGTSTTASYSDSGLTAATAYSYTVSAFDATGNTSAQSLARSVTTQSPPPPAPTATLTANPTSVAAGQTSNLTWSSTNATSCSGTNFTASGISGSVNVTPSQTTTYTVTCVGGGGTKSASATVTVTSAPPPTSQFKIGDRVKTTERVNVRSTAATQGKPVGKQNTNAQGTLIEGPGTGSGYTWWKVNFDSGADGWVIVDALALISSATTQQTQTQTTATTQEASAPAPEPTTTATTPTPAPTTQTPAPEPAPAPTTNLTQGLVGYWSFDSSVTTWSDATHGTTQDLSGNGNTGTITGLTQSVATVAGKLGEALLFSDKVTRDFANYVKLTSTAATSMNSNLTVSAWVYPTSEDCCQGIVSKGSTWFGNGQYMMTLGYPGKSISYMTFSVGTGSGNPVTFKGNTSIPLNTWTHLACTTDTAIISCYKNGTLIGTQDRSSIPPATTGDNWFAIGTMNLNQFYFGGRIDEVRIYNRVLSASEISGL